MSSSIFDVRGDKFDDNLMVFTEISVLNGQKEILLNKVDVCLETGQKELFITYVEDIRVIDDRINSLKELIGM